MSEKPLVVVFGGGGYIGSLVVRYLLDEGFSVRIFDNFLFGCRGIEDLDSPDVEIIEGDICDARAVSHATQGSNAVILLAALVGHLVRDNPLADSRTVNLIAASMVLDTAVEHGVENFIFASTTSVYGTQEGVMYETTTPEPVSLYARLKLRMEERVLKARRVHFHPTVLRVAPCYGYSPRMRFDLVANSMLRDAIYRKKIVVFGGEQCRTFVHVDDAARACILPLTTGARAVSGEIFNVVSSEDTVKMNRLASLVCQAVPDVEVRVEHCSPDLTNCRISGSKMDKMLGFLPRWTLADGIDDTKARLLEGCFEDPYSLRYSNT